MRENYAIPSQYLCKALCIFLRPDTFLPSLMSPFLDVPFISPTVQVISSEDHHYPG